jgi:4-aminobutyrate aminotransferase / (S)-3-amino-2-methylpropionate transaminase / 5-aminovalerate transaminase
MQDRCGLRYARPMAATRAIRLVTEVPGPRSAGVLERLAASVARPLSITFPIAAAEGRGAMLTDVDGNVFLDFTGGVGCLNVGHGHPQVIAAAQAQLERFAHTDFTVVPYEVYAELAERLVALSPFRGPAKAAFFNSGAEAVENAVKFARAWTGRSAVIAFEGAFHGRTALAVAMTSKTHPYKAGLGPFAPEVYRVPFNDVDAIRRAFKVLVPAEDVAAIVFEPVQGEGGFVPATPEFVRGVREICDEHGIAMVCDEVQTGFARTGRMFAIEHYDVEPDLMTIAKSVAGGLPLSGVIGKAAAMDAPADGGVGGTFVGNPVAQAAAVAVLDVIEEERLVERANTIGEAIRERMERWQSRWPEIIEVRGLGAMLAIELTEPEAASRVVEEAFARGLLLLKAGVRLNCIRVLVPLVISDAELDEALGVWEDALEAALRA